MGVGNSSAPRIEKNEIRLEFVHHPVGDDLRHLEKACIFFIGELVPPLDVALCNYQAVTLCVRLDIQYAHGQLIFVDLVGMRLPLYNVAEYAAFLLFHL